MKVVTTRRGDYCKWCVNNRHRNCIQGNIRVALIKYTTGAKVVKTARLHFQTGSQLSFADRTKHFDEIAKVKKLEVNGIRTKRSLKFRDSQGPRSVGWSLMEPT